MITIPKKFSSGGVLSADRLNEIIDCLSEIASVQTVAEVHGGAGLVESNGPGGRVLSLANFAKGDGDTEPKSETSDDGDSFPFKATYKDGTLTIAAGYVLVRPSSFLRGAGTGEGMKITSGSELIQQTLSIPQKKYSWVAEYPESEIAFLRSANFTAEGSTVAQAKIAMPQYKVEKTTTEITVPGTASLSTELTSVDIPSSATATISTTTAKAITSLTVIPDTMWAKLPVSDSDGGTYYTSEVIIHVGEDPAEKTELTSFVTGIKTSTATGSTTNYKFVKTATLSTGSTTKLQAVSDVTISQNGTSDTNVSVTIPTGTSLDTTTELFNPVTGGEIKSEDDEPIELSFQYQKPNVEPQAVDTAGSEFSQETDKAYFKPKMFPVAGTEFACGAGAVVVLICRVSDGNELSTEWKQTTMEEATSGEALEESPQILRVKLETAFTTVSETTDTGESVSNPAFYLKADIDRTEFLGFATTFPIAAVVAEGETEEDGVRVDQLNAGCLTLQPSFCFSLNSEEQPEEDGASESTPAAARVVVFQLENSEFLEALSAKVSPGEE